jgi:hypothetical protein
MSENTNNKDAELEVLLDDDSENIEEIKEELTVKNDSKDIKESKDNKVSDKIENVKIEEAKPQPQAIVTPEPASETPGLAYVGNGVLGSTKVTKLEPKPAAKKAEKKDTVAVHSTRNVTWSGVGKVYIGYNIVTQEAADQWIKRDHIRMATPEEIAREYGQ